MELPGDYMESSMDGDDVAYPCKGCGDVSVREDYFEVRANLIV